MDTMTYKGYTLTQWEDHEDDCTKMWHELTMLDGTRIVFHWTPYESIGFEEFKAIIDNDMVPLLAERIKTARSSHNWNHEDLKKALEAKEGVRK